MAKSELQALREEVAALRREVELLRADRTVHHYHHHAAPTPFVVQPHYPPMTPSYPPGYFPATLSGVVDTAAGCAS